jgi:CubicO group peptidase (beta-lactamase class C family)
VAEGGCADAPTDVFTRDRSVDDLVRGPRADWFRTITPRHILSHSAGTPHGERGTPYPLFFEPGTDWKYSADTFVLENVTYFRLQVVFGEDGQPVKLLGRYEGGGGDESPRD